MRLVITSPLRSIILSAAVEVAITALWPVSESPRKKLAKKLSRLCPTARNALIRLDRIRVPGLIDVAGDAGALPFPDSTFQCALVTEVLEYLQDPTAFASELHRVLDTQGLAVVTVPFVFHEHRDYWRPTRHALVDLFHAYASVRICAQGNRLHTMFDLLTTAFSPIPVLFPLRVLSNLLFLCPNRFALRDSRSTAPTGFLVLARK